MLEKIDKFYAWYLVGEKKIPVEINGKIVANSPIYDYVSSSGLFVKQEQIKKMGVGELREFLLSRLLSKDEALEDKLKTGSVFCYGGLKNAGLNRDKIIRIINKFGSKYESYNGGIWDFVEPLGKKDIEKILKEYDND